MGRCVGGWVGRWVLVGGSMGRCVGRWVGGSVGRLVGGSMCGWVGRWVGAWWVRCLLRACSVFALCLLCVGSVLSVCLFCACSVIAVSARACIDLAHCHYSLSLFIFNVHCQWHVIVSGMSLS